MIDNSLSTKSNTLFRLLLSDENSINFVVADSFKIIYVYHGEVEINIEKEVFHLNEVDYVLITPNVRYSISFLASNSAAFEISFDESNYNSFMLFWDEQFKKSINDNKYFVVSSDFNVQNIIGESYFQMLKNSDNSEIFIRIMMNEFMVGIIRYANRKMHSDLIPVRIVNAIREFYNPENIKEGIPALERLLCFSRSQSSRVIKKYYNTTLVNFVTVARLEYACTLIKNSNESIDQIVNDVGFNSTSHFYRIFKDYYGITPRMVKNSK